MDPEDAVEARGPGGVSPAGPPPAAPPALARRLAEVHGTAGARFVAELPARVEALAARWRLRVEAPFPALSYAWVAPATRADGTRAVLKTTVPHRALECEIEALRLFDGCGAARILEADAEAGALLLERLEPGTPLDAREPEDAAATRIAARTLRALARPAPAEHPFPTLAEWCEAFARVRRREGAGSTRVPRSLLEMLEAAEARFAELEAEAPPPAVLHGDLHHGNLLAADGGTLPAGGGMHLPAGDGRHLATGGGSGYRAIDPKGVVGDPASEVGPFLRNPAPGLAERPDLAETLARRLDIFAEELPCPRERLAGWGFVHAVLSACWSLENHGGGHEPALRVAGHLADPAGI